MPNNMMNWIEVTGSKAVEVARCLMNGENSITFNKLIPMPKVLEGLNKVYSKGGNYYCREKEGVDNPFSELPRVPDDEIVIIIATHGTASWYDWRIEHWGTKWDAYEVSDINVWFGSEVPVGTSIEATEERFRACFYTAWSPPLLVYSALAKKLGLDTTTMQICWRDEFEEDITKGEWK